MINKYKSLTPQGAFKIMRKLMTFKTLLSTKLQVINMLFNYIMVHPKCCMFPCSREKFSQIQNHEHI